MNSVLKSYSNAEKNDSKLISYGSYVLFIKKTFHRIASPEEPWTILVTQCKMRLKQSLLYQPYLISEILHSRKISVIYSPSTSYFHLILHMQNMISCFYHLSVENTTAKYISVLINCNFYFSIHFVRVFCWFLMTNKSNFIKKKRQKMQEARDTIARSAEIRQQRA